MSRNNPFPWHYFIRSIRTRVVLVTLSCILTYTICQAYEEYIFPKVLLVILFFTISAIIQGYLKIVPFRKILAKIDEIQVQLPHNKKLNIIYQKSEWVLIQEMLKLTQKYIKEQNKQIMAREQEAQIILESIADPIILIDSFLSCKQYNQAFKTRFIQDKTTKVFKDDKLWKIFDDSIILELFEQAKAQGKIARLSGHQIDRQYYNISITPILSEKSENIGLLGLFHNVTESKLTEKMRVDFVANVSHEIRTPLTSIKGFSQFLLAQKEICPPSIQSSLERIVYNSERLQDLFDNLLKLSIIESKYAIEKERFELSKLILTIENNLRHKHPNAMFIIENQITGPIYGDKKLLEQVFTNLIDNSIKYGHNSKTKISIHTKKTQNRDLIVLKDNGQGIPESDLKRIFERFYRIQGQNYQQIDGTGLGLSIVKHIINKHNGHISVASEVDKGAKFTIELPSM